MVRDAHYQQLLADEKDSTRDDTVFHPNFLIYAAVNLLLTLTVLWVRVDPPAAIQWIPLAFSSAILFYAMWKDYTAESAEFDFRSVAYSRIRRVFAVRDPNYDQLLELDVAQFRRFLIQRDLLISQPVIYSLLIGVWLYDWLIVMAGVYRPDESAFDRANDLPFAAAVTVGFITSLVSQSVILIACSWTPSPRYFRQRNESI